MKMLKVHQNAPTSMLKSQNFSGGHTPDPISKAEGREGRGWVGLGREGIGVWPTQKLSRGAPYESRHQILDGGILLNKENVFLLYQLNSYL
jgi:hypothetical protein